MNNLISICLVTISVFLLASSTHIDAAIYKWKDDKGQIHYSAIAPANGTKKDNIEAEIARVSQVTITPSKAVNTDNATNNATDNTEANADGTTDDNTNNKGSNAGYCKQQQDIIKSLENNPYVKWKEGDKETLLEGEQKAAQVEKIKSDMKKFCSSETTTKQEG